MTPDRALHVRDYRFAGYGAADRWWLNGDPVASAIFDGLSATFPHGEHFFMDSLRPYRDEAPDPLRDQIAAFIKQEAIHTREHVAFNRHIAAHGRNLEAMDRRSKAVVDVARAGSPLARLAATAALEHLTAVLGHVILSNPGYLKGADPEVSRLWRWHALEEVEHKAVAFDALAHAMRNTSALRRWLLRTAVMARMSLLFIGPTLNNIVQILQEDGLSSARIGAGLTRYILVHPGPLWRSFPLYLAYYMPAFHPWKLDDSDLLSTTEQELASSREDASFDPLKGLTASAGPGARP